MKKIFLSMMALAIAMSTFAYDLAEKDTVYYGSGCAAIGLADGTVGVYRNYIEEGTAAWVPATIQVWENEVMTAEYEVSQVGYYDTAWNKGWSFEVKIGETDITAQVTSLTINEGVKRIEESAFGWKLTALEDVKLPSTLESIGAYAFGALDSLKSIVCAAETAPALLPVVQDASWSADHFKGNASWDAIITRCKIYVPSEVAKETYNQDPWTYWTAFYTNNNVEIMEQTSVAAIGTDGQNKARKVVRDGMILIERNGVLYNLTGVSVQ